MPIGKCRKMFGVSHKGLATILKETVPFSMFPKRMNGLEGVGKVIKGSHHLTSD